MIQYSEPYVLASLTRDSQAGSAMDHFFLSQVSYNAASARTLLWLQLTNCDYRDWQCLWVPVYIQFHNSVSFFWSGVHGIYFCLSTHASHFPVNRQYATLVHEILLFLAMLSFFPKVASIVWWNVFFFTSEVDFNVI